MDTSLESNTSSYPATPNTKLCNRLILMIYGLNSPTFTLLLTACNSARLSTLTPRIWTPTFLITSEQGISMVFCSTLYLNKREPNT
ncbi:hypothetical protein TNIN_121251 [Trichonephila inaurata madagascariensis]|uniref:Uncharacterized protein n=1 Tax=Trichonephila inaurata madagascariensis TaxID=2747483 RepID=A0A8X6WNK9_9ARAC|nr:hypothetical protein TNIN_121251 [Trichonephila inaurata madagascariensis]